MIERMAVYGNSSIGVFCLATDSYVLTPPDIPDKIFKIVESTLRTPIIKTRIGESVLLGALVVGNSRGLLLPHFVTRDELDLLNSELDVNIAVLPSRRTALGNIILVNDKAAVVHPDLEVKARKTIEDVLDVEVVDFLIAGLPIVGAVAVITNRGGVLHPMTSEEALKVISNIFKVNVDVGTVNAGFPYVGTGIIGNSRGALVGAATTGPELAHIERALGLLEV